MSLRTAYIIVYVFELGGSCTKPVSEAYASQAFGRCRAFGCCRTVVQDCDDFRDLESKVLRQITAHRTVFAPEDVEVSKGWLLTACEYSVVFRRGSDRIYPIGISDANGIG